MPSITSSHQGPAARKRSPADCVVGPAVHAADSAGLAGKLCMLLPFSAQAIGAASQLDYRCVWSCNAHLYEHEQHILSIASFST